MSSLTSFKTFFIFFVKKKIEKKLQIQQIAFDLEILWPQAWNADLKGKKAKYI